MASQDFQPSLSFQWRFTDLQHSFQGHSLGFLLVLIVFSIILIIVFLYFYNLFVCRYGHFSADDDHTTNLTAAPHATAQPPGLDSAAINNLPIFLHRSRATSPMEESGSAAIIKESECSICLGLFEEEEWIKVFPKCLHAYHSECLDKWLSARSSCPLCRAPLL